MNLLCSAEALSHVSDCHELFTSSSDFCQLDTYTWDRSALKDRAMLPLGVAVTDIS
jgi:hypothetical protein